MIIPQGDFEFLKFAMHRLGIHKPIKVMRSASKKKWPDIWCLPDKPVGEIWVTNEWAKQPIHERRKRLLHELFHFRGLEHGTYNGLIYSTLPAKDTYSLHHYQKMVELKKNPEIVKHRGLGRYGWETRSAIKIKPKTKDAKTEINLAKDTFIIKTKDGAYVNGHFGGGKDSEAEIFYVEVPKSLRNTGVGKSLINDAKELLKANNKKITYSSVTSKEGQYLSDSLRSK